MNSRKCFDLIFLDRTSNCCSGLTKCWTLVACDLPVRICCRVRLYIHTATESRLLKKKQTIGKNKCPAPFHLFSLVNGYTVVIPYCLVKRLTHIPHSCHALFETKGNLRFRSLELFGRCAHEDTG